MSDRPDTMLLYGPTDSGKTSELGEIAEWEFERSGMLTRLISADSNWKPLEDPSTKFPKGLILSAENPNGIVQAINIQALKDPWAKLVKLAEGYWPRLAPLPGGGFNLVLQPSKMAKDSQGKDRIQLDDGRFIGQIFIEGLSTLGGVLLQDHADHAQTRPMWGTGEGGAATFDSIATVDKAGKPEQEKLTIGRAVGGHYGSVQKWVLYVLVPRFGELRSVKRVVWTAHVGRGEDKFTGIKKSALGPHIVGQASIDETPQKFAHTLHFEVETSIGADKKVRREFKAWFVSHRDDQLKTLEWPAKVSMGKRQARELLEKFPSGYVDRGKEGIKPFLDILYPQG